MKVFKYPLEIIECQKVLVPRGARYLSLLTQDDKPVIYAMVDPEEKETEPWEFEMRGTGHEAGIVENCEFLGTLSMRGGQFILHVWRRRV